MTGSAEKRIIISGMGIVSAAGFGTKSFGDALKKSGSLIGINESAGTYSARIPEADIKEQISRYESVFKKSFKESMHNIRRMPSEIGLAVYAAAEAVHESKLDQFSDKRKIAVIGAGTNIFNAYTHFMTEKYQDDLRFITPSYALHYLDTNLIGCISSLFDIRGEGFVIGGASASSVSAIVRAFHMLKEGVCEKCIIISSPSFLGKAEINSYLNLGAMRAYDADILPEKACCPFDVEHNGFVLGEAAACIILDSVDDNSVKSGDIEIMSAVSMLDGNHLSNPDIEGETDVMISALEKAGISRTEIDYINTHGTSTPLGDNTEAEAIKRIYGDKPFVNSDKSIIGHCLNSAGLCEVISTVIQLRNGFVHGNANLTAAAVKGLNYAGKNSINHPLKTAQKNAFGFGGINTSCILRSV